MAGGVLVRKIEGGGGGFRGGGAGGGRAPGECLWGGGGGLNIFFSGLKCPPRIQPKEYRQQDGLNA